MHLAFRVKEVVVPTCVPAPVVPVVPVEGVCAPAIPGTPSDISNQPLGHSLSCIKIPACWPVPGLAIPGAAAAGTAVAECVRQVTKMEG